MCSISTYALRADRQINKDNPKGQPSDVFNMYVEEGLPQEVKAGSHSTSAPTFSVLYFVIRESNS